MNEVEKLQKLIDEANNIVFFGGAGVSTESGVKDFRGKNGLYNERNSFDYDKSPEYMLSHKCLFEEPEAFFKYYRANMDYSKIEPNITHKYLVKLEEKGKLKAIVTQNIDGLHQKAGSKNILELHGTVNRCYCVSCGKVYDGDYILKSKKVPICECGGMVRPDVVLYGEKLPSDYDKAAYFISKADLLIVAGTSLTVYPASGLLNFFGGGQLVIINETATPYDDMAELVIHKKLGTIFSKLK